MSYSRSVFAASFLCSILVFGGCSAPATSSQARPGVLASTDNDNDARRESGRYSVPAKDRSVSDELPVAAPRKVQKARLPSQPAQTEQVARTQAPAVETPAPVTPTLTLPAPAPPPIDAPVPPAEVKEVKPEPVEPATKQIAVPSGTPVSVRLIDPVDSATSHVGETFKASLDSPLVVDNETVFPRGAEVYVKLTKVESAGSLSGRSELELQLDRIFLGKTSYALESNKFVNTGASQGTRTARTAGIGAAIGAAIGAIAGGGKGAVLGGATGAGAGVGVEAIRKGEQIRVDSETRLDFQLQSPVQVTVQYPTPTNSLRTFPSGPPRFSTR